MSSNLSKVPSLNWGLQHTACFKYFPCRQHREGHERTLNYFFRDGVSEQDNNDFKRNSLSLQSIKLLKHFSPLEKILLNHNALSDWIKPWDPALPLQLLFQGISSHTATGERAATAARFSNAFQRIDLLSKNCVIRGH